MKKAAIFLLLGYSLVACAQQPAGEKVPASLPQVTAGSAVDAAKAAKIHELIRMTGVADIALDLMKRQMDLAKKTLPIPPRAQDDFANEFIAAVNMDDFVNLMVPIYSRHFTEADLDGMIAFYRSPLGQKTLKELPLVVAEGQKAGAEWGRQIGFRIGTQIGERVRAGEYGPWPPANGSAPQPPAGGEFKPATPAPAAEDRPAK